jgi:hypothetical protein
VHALSRIIASLLGKNKFTSQVFSRGAVNIACGKEAGKEMKRAWRTLAQVRDNDARVHLHRPISMPHTFTRHERRICHCLSHERCLSRKWCTHSGPPLLSLQHTARRVWEVQAVWHDAHQTQRGKLHCVSVEVAKIRKKRFGTCHKVTTVFALL